MLVTRSLAATTHERNSVVTIGTFDGVHLAHTEILREVVNRAKTKEGRSVVVTFDPHPKEVVSSPKGPVKLLSTIEERVELIGEMGVDLLLILEFTFAFSRIGSREFYREYIVQGTGVDEVVVGYDHMFGRDREAGIDELVRMGKEFNFSVFAVHPFTVAGEPVSSTRIRHALQTGNVARATQFLGRAYSFTGTVVKGDGRGRTLGFPTANIEPLSASKVMPAHGVYVVGARVGHEQHYGMMNIGVRPTVSAGAREIIEAHLFDVERDLYGERVTVSLLGRLRDEKKFDSLEDLRKQLTGDLEMARKTVKELVG